MSKKKPSSVSFTLPPLPTPPTPVVPDQASHTQVSSLMKLTPTALFASVTPLVESRSVELLVEQLQDITPQAAYNFLEELIKQPRSMDTDEVIQVAYGLIGYFINNKEQQDEIYHILDLINTAPQLQKRSPLLAIAAYSNYPYVIPLILHWAKARNMLESTINDSLLFIAHNFNTSMLQRLEQNGVTITPKRATFILWNAVQVPLESLIFEDNEDRAAHLAAKNAFVKLLISKDADLKHHENGYTMLMHATKNNDTDTMEQLLQHGADANRIVNDAVGSALQLAIAHELIDAELLLRHYNAHE